MMERKAEAALKRRAETGLQDILAELWEARKFMAAGIFLGALAALIFVHAAVPHYQARMMIAPANPMNGSDIPAVLDSQDSFALRYIARSIGAANSSDFMRFEHVYAGPSVSAFLLKDEQVLEGVRKDRAFAFSQPFSVESAEALSEHIRKRVRLEPVGSTPLRRMTYAHPDPHFATYLLQNIHRISDELIRLKLKGETAKRAAYLQKAIDETSNPEHRRALTALLLEQERLRMLVSIEMPYAAAVVEPPSASPRAVWPQAWLILPAFIFAGALAAFFAYSLASALRANPPKRISSEGRGWFKMRSGNTNRRYLANRDAAE